MTKKKILIPIAGFGNAGGSRVLSQLANHWIDAGHQVDFLVHRAYAEPCFPTQAGIRLFGTSDTSEQGKSRVVRSLETPSSASIHIEMFNALNRIGSNFDVILANHSLTAFPVAFASCGLAKKFYYVQAYEPEYYRARRPFKARILEILSILSYSLPLRQIANSPIYIGYKRIKARAWVPPGIDLSNFHGRNQLPKFTNGSAWTIGTIGRHELGKGTMYVLEAFKKLALMDPNVHLKVAFGNLPTGWSHERAEVVMPKNDDDLADFYRSVDVLVAPGIVQLGACHYPVIEAMACGTPVITTGYLPADSKNAWLVPIRDSDAIVAALLNIQKAGPNEIARKVEMASEAVKPFSWEKVAADFIKHLGSTNANR